MSQQYPGPQQPPYQGQPYPGPYPPPQPPKKGLSTGAIIAIVIGGVFALLIIVGALAGGSSTSDKPTAKKAATPSAAAKPSVKAPAAKPSAQAPAAKAAPTKAAPKPKEYADGDYVVGEDIPAGTYTTPGAEAGAFELCMISTKPKDDSEMPQLKSANKGDRIIITLAKVDGVVTISGCEPLTLRK